MNLMAIVFGWAMVGLGVYLYFPPDEDNSELPMVLVCWPTFVPMIIADWFNRRP